MSETIWTNAGGSLGSLNIPATSIPTGFTALELRIECASWVDTGSAMALNFQWSPDGSGWTPWAVAVMRGGQQAIKAAGGGALQTSVTRLALPAAYESLYVKASGLVSGSALVSSGLTLAVV